MDKPSQHFDEMPYSEKGGDGEHLQLDKHGLPLDPQPTKYKDDPLVSTPG